MDGKRKVILVDMDGVLADFEQGILNASEQKFHPSQVIPLTERKSFFVVQDYPLQLRPSVQEIYKTPGFFENLPVIPGGRESLEQMKALGHEVFICTMAIVQYDNCVLEKYNWVAKHLGEEWTEKMILTRDKTLVRGHILIDDKPHYRGVQEPSWEHVLYDAPYNRSILGKRRLTWETWQDVLAELSASNLVKTELSVN